MQEEKKTAGVPKAQLFLKLPFQLLGIKCFVSVFVFNILGSYLYIEMFLNSFYITK